MSAGALLGGAAQQEEEEEWGLEEITDRRSQVRGTWEEIQGGDGLERRMPCG